MQPGEVEVNQTVMAVEILELTRRHFVLSRSSILAHLPPKWQMYRRGLDRPLLPLDQALTGHDFPVRLIQ
ncbi:hypothetical protein CU103_10620 [Phyllobacterium sophorae]|uniref:Uncharacterized protein n=1 Tax=Phyllobacterium sophorae TaxID=1520277 RepID=A0A2P7BG20_9HYPH|nr:hypothetical protein CU103_10620 [Phyllobacterium sophorae]